MAEKRKKLKPKLNNIYANDIKKYLQKSGVTENSLLLTKYKLDYLKQKKKQKDFLLKYNGGVANNPEIGEELFNISLNIIKGKLAIIEEIEKKCDENNKKGINDKYKFEEFYQNLDKDQSFIDKRNLLFKDLENKFCSLPNQTSITDFLKNGKFWELYKYASS